MRHDDLSLFPIFIGLRNEELELLMQQGKEKIYNKNDYIFIEGEMGNELHVILEGEVGILKTSPNGETNLINKIGEGDCIGEMSMVDIEPRSASLIVLSEKARTIAFDAENLKEYFFEHKDAFIVILLNLNRIISRRLRKLEQDVAKCNLNNENFATIELDADVKLINQILQSNLMVQMKIYNMLKEKFEKYDF